MRAAFLGLLALPILLAFPSGAAARVSQDYAYPFAQVWSSSLRLVRVDLRGRITDRDEETGFLLFEYVEGSRSYPGSIEFVRTQVERRDGTRVVVQIPALPSYVERMVVDKLGRKLVEDFGEPPPPPPPPPPPRQPDARPGPGNHPPTGRPNPSAPPQDDDADDDGEDHRGDGQPRDRDDSDDDS